MLERRVVVHALVIALALLVMGSGALTAQGPTLTISAPEGGATVAAPVTIAWGAEGVTVRPAGEAASREEGHFHVFVDRTPELAEGTPIAGGDPQIIHTAGTSLEIAELAEGEHTVTVVLGYSDHTPWWPQVSDSVTFTVGAMAEGASEPAPETLPTAGAATRDAMYLLAAGLGALLLGLALLRRRHPA